MCVCVCVYAQRLLKQPLHKSSQFWEGERGSWWESLDGGGGQSPLCPSLLGLCWVWQPAGQLARRPITELPLISRHDRTREAGREWEWLKSDCPWESRMEGSERRGKRESKERQTVHRIGEKLLPAAEKVSASLLSIRPQRKRFIILIIPLLAFNPLLPFLIYLGWIVPAF